MANRVNDIRKIGEVMNTMKENRKIRRGDIYYIIQDGSNVGSEQAAGRPAIIVSNDTGNMYSKVYEVVFLTTQTKHNLPTHFTVNSSRYESTALCEAVQSVDISLIGKLEGHLTQDELDKLDKCLKISLDLKEKEKIDAGDDTILQNVNEHIAELIRIGNKVSKLNKAIKTTSDALNVKFDTLGGLGEVLSLEAIDKVRECALAELKGQRDKYYAQLAKISNTVSNTDQDCQPTRVQKKKRSKVDDSTILQLYKDNLTQRQIAAKVGLTPSAICSRITKLKKEGLI